MPGRRGHLSGGRAAQPPADGLVLSRGGSYGESQQAAIKASNSARTKSSSPSARSRKASVSSSSWSAVIRSHPIDNNKLRRARVAGSGVDLLAVGVRVRDRDLARLGLLGDWDLQGQYAGLVARLDVIGVQGVTQEQLPGEHAEWTLGDLHLHVVAEFERSAFGLHREYVAFHVQIDRVR